MQSMTRRDLMRSGAGAVAAGGAIQSALLDPAVLGAQASSGAPAGRTIRFVSIGTGIRGCDLLRSARHVPTGVLVGTADLYDMHQKAGIEAYGADVPTTRDYRRLLDRKDVDAVIVAVADHQHRRVVLDAVAAGKDVYCEKPMSHNVADGTAMVKAVQSGKRIFQCGSQRVSNIVYKKAAEIYASGRLGEVHYIEGTLRPQLAFGRLGLSGSARCQPAEVSTGKRFCAMRRRGLSTRRASSAGAASPITAKAWPAICLFTCCRVFSASAASMPFPAARFPAEA